MAGGKPFRLSIVSDVSDVLRGNRDIAGSFDEVADSLDDVARESRDAGKDVARGLGDGAEDAARDVDRAMDKIGDSLEGTGDEARDAGRDIERHLEDAGREGEQAAEKLERSFKEAFDGLKTGARTSSQDVARDTRAGMDDAGRSTEAFRDEARQNLSESLSSFRGEIEDIPDLIQGTFGGVIGDLGVGGMIGAGLVAAGAGLALKFYENYNEQAERVEQRIESMYDDMLESGQDYLSRQYLNEQISGILHGAEDAVIDYARAQEIAAETGLEVATVVRGYAGDAESAAAVQDALNEKIRESETAWRNAVDNGADPFGSAIQSDSPRLEGYRDKLAEVSGNVATASERAAVYRDAHLASSEAVRDHVSALAEIDDALAEAREEIAANNAEIADATERARANDGVLADLADTLLELRDSARDAGAGTADLTALQAEQAEQFLTTAAAAGYERDEALALGEQLGLIPRDVATDIRQNGADHVVSKAREVRDAAAAAADRDYPISFTAALPSRAELQERLNALVWGLTAPAAQVRVRYGQNME